MNPVKALQWIVAFGVFCPALAADELAITPPTIIETPPLAHLSPPWLLRGSVGTSGTNAVFVWTRAAGDGPTNLFLTRLGDSGRPVEEPPRFIESEFYTAATAELYPADGGFFIRYFDRTNRLSPSPSHLVMTRIDAAGNPAFPPVTISTNQFKESDTASNGRSLLLLVENYRQTVQLDYTIVGWNGEIVSTGVLQGESDLHSFAAASDGKDFLAVWSARTLPYLRVTRFSGTDGSSTTVGLGTNSMVVQTAAHGANGYLVAGRASLMHLRDDGTLITRTNITSFGSDVRQEVIYPEGEGWILFTALAGTLQSFRVTPMPDGLRVEPNPYPAIQNLYLSGTFIPPLVSLVAPFGAGRYLLARDNGVSVLTSTGVTAAVPPPTMYAEQTDSGVVASPFGYLVEWTEHRDLGYSIRGLRFAPDGSALDDHSFEIGTFYDARTNPRSAVFDGKDYVVEWNILTSPVQIARISPQGAPDVRLQSYSIDTRGYEVYLISQKGDLFACRGAVTTLVPDVHIWKLGVDGQVSPEVIVHGYGAFSDGANLFSLGVDDVSNLYKIAVDPAAPNPEISSNVIAVATGSNFAQLRHGFVAQWFDQQINSSFAYFSNGQEKRGPAPRNIVRAFADSDDRLLMASLPLAGSRLSRFNAFNFQTGAQSSAEADVGQVTDLHVASFGTDFLGVTEALNLGTPNVGKFWITTTKPPTLGAPSLTATSSLSTTLNLDANRRYRIETSSDLVNWTLQQVVSGSASVTVTIPADSQGFVRAILVPE